ncbi:hypothetical protein BDW42DRAFT_196883 [Aspergillus taichungensis]|uniref:Uncharacterized protein n=1 Tax=Aspergillus taichungensis TaxID=482145 RepID=A0A2J5HIH7_9EURO|nr:hypothetical protein BDW42DRAFT_196883 [Aspergillus taichungensis]
MKTWTSAPKPLTFTPTTSILCSSASLGTRPDPSSSTTHCFFIPLHNKTIDSDEELLQAIKRALHYAIHNEGPESRRALYACPVRGDDDSALSGGVWICFCFPDHVVEKGDRAMLYYAEMYVKRAVGDL